MFWRSRSSAITVSLTRSNWASQMKLIFSPSSQFQVIFLPNEGKASHKWNLCKSKLQVNYELRTALQIIKQSLDWGGVSGTTFKQNQSPVCTYELKQSATTHNFPHRVSWFVEIYQNFYRQQFVFDSSYSVCSKNSKFSTFWTSAAKETWNFCW